MSLRWIRVISYEVLELLSGCKHIVKEELALTCRAL
jgi:hypothetical protein